MLKRIFKGIVYFLGILTLISIICAACSDEETSYIENVGPNEAVLVVPDESDSEVEVIVPEEPVQQEPQIPMEYRQALKKAQRYIEYSAFSKEELRGQLEYHEFAQDAIQFALDNVEADWYAEAVEQAESYLEYSTFSREDLRGQLEYEGFDVDEIEHALNAVYGE